MDHGIKIAKPGFPVQSTSLGNLVFHSGKPILKIRDTGNGVIVLNNGSGPTTILLSNHRLGYVPRVRVKTQWYNVDTAVKESTFREAPFLDTLVGGAVYFQAQVDVTDQNLSFTVTAFDGFGGSYNLEYFFTIYYDEDA